MMLSYSNWVHFFLHALNMPYNIDENERLQLINKVSIKDLTHQLFEHELL